MPPINVRKHARQFRSRFTPRTLVVFSTAVFLYLLLSPSARAQCDMGNAYSYTDTWASARPLDLDGDGEIADYDHTAPNFVAAVGVGVAENTYNSCGHEYYTVVTMTGPNSGYSEGINSTSLDISLFLDGDYITDSTLYYYCPIAGRDFAGAVSSAVMSVDTFNEIWYGYTREMIVGPAGNPIRACFNRACIETDENPPNGCYKPNWIHYLNTSQTCPRGTLVAWSRPSVLGIPLPCLPIYERDINSFSPCPFGTK